MLKNNLMELNGSQANLVLSLAQLSPSLLHFLLKTSIYITCSLVIRSLLSLLFFCGLVNKAVKSRKHLGHFISSQVYVLGHLSGNSSVSLASNLATSGRIPFSGISLCCSKYLLVLSIYFCVRPQSSLCCSQSSS